MSKSGCFCIVRLRLTFFPLIDQLFKENFKDVLNSTSISQQGKKNYSTVLSYILIINT